MPQAARGVTHREAGTAWRESHKNGAATRHPNKKKCRRLYHRPLPSMRRSQPVTGAWHPFLQQ
ncbi:hypothetical protein DU191_17870 [Salmonella enterica subsp. enterica serovar Sandiego]|nr:hypothetical protein [Salmonella enterica subsp. enterica serovar Sandiego]